MERTAAGAVAHSLTLRGASTIGTLAAVGPWRLSSRPADMARRSALLPLIVPPAVPAPVVYQVFVQIKRRVGLRMLDRYPGLIAAHGIPAIPFVVMTVSAAPANRAWLEPADFPAGGVRYAASFGLSRLAGTATRAATERLSDVDEWRALGALSEDADLRGLPASNHELRRISRRVASRPGFVPSILHPRSDLRGSELRTRGPESRRQPTARLHTVTGERHLHSAQHAFQGQEHPASRFRVNAQPGSCALPAAQG